MRCPDCSKMVSFDDPQVEVQSEEIDNDGHVTIEVREVLPCAECGTELKEMNFSLEYDIEHECKKEEGKEKDQKDEDKEEGFDLDVGDPESTEEYRPKTDPKGKAVPMRYQKHYYGVSISGTARCKKCDEEIPFEIQQDEQSSAFDELV